MGFKRQEADKLLAATGRRCCICGSLHNVQLHHIVSKEKGGTDDIDNAIPLCPNCHDEVHGSYASGRTARSYSPNELKLHRQRAIEHVRKEGKWAPLKLAREEDKGLILFYAQVLDRPAFRTPFHQEMSFPAFDKAMEDTLIAFDTGYWRTRDAALIGQAQGKVYIIYPPWREKVEHIVGIVESIRWRFNRDVKLHPRMLTRRRFRPSRSLCHWMNGRRQEVIDIMNSMLQEIGHPPLRGIND
jgi:hypothetical protein